MIAIWTGIDATHSIRISPHSVDREGLLRSGVPSSGWLYKAEPVDVIMNPDTRTIERIVQFDEFVCAFQLRNEGTWVSFDIGDDRFLAKSRSLSGDSWRRSGQPAKVNRDGSPVYATRWPVHVRYLSEDPSTFEVEELGVLPEKKTPTWLSVGMRILNTAAGLFCAAAIFGYSLYLLIDLVPLYGGCLTF